MENNYLIKRIHPTECSGGYSWKQLSSFLGKKIIPLESTKAFVQCNNLFPLTDKLEQYNKKNYTDFFKARIK